MFVPRWTTIAAIGAVSLLGLTACSSDSEADATASPAASTSTSASPSSDPAADAAAAQAAVDSITWVDGDDAPSLEFEAPLNVPTSALTIVNEGDGEELVDGMIISLTYTMWKGLDQTLTYSTYEQGKTESVTLSEGMIDPVMYEALVGQKVGTDFIYGTPDSTSAAEDGSPTSSFMAVTVQKATVPLEGPSGEAVEPAAGLPTVTLDDTGKPSVDFSTAGDKPTELVVQPLIKGEGDVVEETDALTVNYTGWLWDGDQFDSSWDRGEPITFSLSGVIPGWTQGLTGQTVGSQVLLVIPPDLGYGSAGSGSAVPGDSTLVFVVDILAAT